METLEEDKGCLKKYREKDSSYFQAIVKFKVCNQFVPKGTVMGDCLHITTE